MRFTISIAIAALCAVNLASAIVCPENYCASADCSSVQAELDSCEGRIQQGAGFCGCCPACIKQLNEGEVCFSNLFGVSQNVECAEGLECHATKKTCQKKQPEIKGPCHEEYFRKSSSMLLGVQLPECLEDGSYAPVQCHEAVCMCVDSNGKQIEQFSASVGERNSMNCQCARDKDHMKIAMIYTEHDCDAKGSYNPVQCTFGSECWCVDSMGKKSELFESKPRERKDELGDCSPRGPCHEEWLSKQVPPTSMIIVQVPQCLEDGTYSPVQCHAGQCYCADHEGKRVEQYGSVAETEKMTLGCVQRQTRQLVLPEMFGACAQQLDLIELHPEHLGSQKPQCLDDGTYHPRQCREAVCMCVDSQGKNTGHYANVGKASQMSCECARAQADYVNTGMVGQTYNCDELGNYAQHRCVGSVCFCTDVHGNQDMTKPSVSIGQLSSLDCSDKVEQVGPCAQELQNQGQSQLLGSRKPACLEDGTYHPRQCYGSVCTCVDSNGSMTEWKAPISQANSMGCQCARDLHDYMNTGMIGKLFYCDELGNYQQQ